MIALDLAGETMVCDNGLKELTGLANLTTLNLDKTQATDDRARALSSLKNLVTLHWPGRT